MVLGVSLERIRSLHLHTIVATVEGNISSTNPRCVNLTSFLQKVGALDIVVMGRDPTLVPSPAPHVLLQLRRRSSTRRGRALVTHPGIL